MERIKDIKAIEILDSKGDPTVKVKLKTVSGIFEAMVPSGASTGKLEACEIRDGTKRYNGRGVQRAVNNVNNILSVRLKGKDVEKQQKIDEVLIAIDGTQNKSQLGANAILGVSAAVCRAGAAAKKMPLYKYIACLAGNSISDIQYLISNISPCFLLIEGGLHGGNDLNVQEFMITPQADSFKEKLRIGTEIYWVLRSILSEKYGKYAVNVGFEGGFAPSLEKTEKVLDLITLAAKKAGYLPKIKILLDVAASTFYQKNSYAFENSIFTSGGLLKFYSNLVESYPITAIEDPFDEEDWQGFQMITEKLASKITIIGDDLLVTNIQRIREAKEKKACNGLILKLNQIGTISEAIDAAKEARNNGWKVFVKHRGGETCDSFIADFVVGLGTGWIMAGAPARGERVVKYNRLLEIEAETK